MSRQAERVARRLMKRHGFRFKVDPCNFRIRCDRFAVSLNVNGGQGVHQWQLWCDPLSNWPEGSCGGRSGLFEIGSDIGAGELLRAPFWSVYWRGFGGPYGFWTIDADKHADKTDPRGED